MCSIGILQMSYPPLALSPQREPGTLADWKSRLRRIRRTRRNISTVERSDAVICSRCTFPYLSKSEKSSLSAVD